MERVQVMRSSTHYSQVPGPNPLNDGDQGQTGWQDTGLEATWAIPQVATLHEKTHSRWNKYQSKDQEKEPRVKSLLLG